MERGSIMLKTGLVNYWRSQGQLYTDRIITQAEYDELVELFDELEFGPNNASYNDTFTSPLSVGSSQGVVVAAPTDRSIGVNVAEET